MLVGFRPGAGKAVPLTLTFREAGTVTADFALVADSKAAWAGFD
jgi:hypothetical protein